MVTALWSGAGACFIAHEAVCTVNDSDSNRSILPFRPHGSMYEYALISGL